MREIELIDLLNKKYNRVLTISQLSPFVELKFRLQEIYGCRLALRFQDEEVFICILILILFIVALITYCEILIYLNKIQILE